MKVRVMVKDAEGEFSFFEGFDLQFKQKDRSFEIYFLSLVDGMTRKTVIAAGVNHMLIRFVDERKAEPVEKKFDPFTAKAQLDLQTPEGILDAYNELKPKRKRRTKAEIEAEKISE